MPSRLKIYFLCPLILVFSICCGRKIPLTTNEIDRAFDRSNFQLEKRGWPITDVGFKGDYIFTYPENQKKDHFKRYYLNQFYSWPVSTNWPTLYPTYRHKKQIIDSLELEKNFQMTLIDTQELMCHFQSVQELSTDYLEEMCQRAIQSDALIRKKENPQNLPRIYYGPGPNMARFRIENTRVIRWNDEVRAYKKTLLDIATNQLNRIWKNFPSKEREIKIENFLRQFGVHAKLSNAK